MIRAFFYTSFLYHSYFSTAQIWVLVVLCLPLIDWYVLVQGVLYGSVGFVCGLIGQGIANLIMNAKRYAFLSL